MTTQSDDSHSSQNKRRWARLGIRTMLVITLLVTLPLAYLNHQCELVKREQRFCAKCSSSTRITYHEPIGNNASGVFRYLPRSVYPELFEKRVKKIKLEESRIETLADVLCLGELESLSIDNCPQLRSLAGMEKLPRLAQLFVSYSTLIQDYQPITKSKQLKCLYLCVDEKTTSLDFLKGLTELEELTISGNKNLRDFSAINSLPNLRRLRVQRCEHIQDVTFLAGVPNLRSLVIRNCCELTSLEGISGISSLREVHIVFCHRLSDLPYLGNLKNVSIFDFEACASISDVSALLDLESLETSLLETRFPKKHHEQIYGGRIKLLNRYGYWDLPRIQNWLMDLKFPEQTLRLGTGPSEFDERLLKKKAGDLEQE